MVFLLLFTTQRRMRRAGISNVHVLDAGRTIGFQLLLSSSYHIFNCCEIVLSQFVLSELLTNEGVKMWTISLKIWNGLAIGQMKNKSRVSSFTRGFCRAALKHCRYKLITSCCMPDRLTAPAMKILIDKGQSSGFISV